jgi:DNA replication protein DnaC
MTCDLCSDEKYLLANVEGVLKATICGCFACDQCDGQGTTYDDGDDGCSTAKPCKCASLREGIRLLNQSGIPGRFCDVTLNGYEPGTPSQSEARTLAADYIRDFEQTPQGLVLMGFPGVGKTHLAVSMIKELALKKGVVCKFTDFSDLLADLRHGYSQNISDRNLLKPYLDSKVMVIDELGKGRNTEWELAIMDQVISARYNAGDKITICTSNYLSTDNRYSLKERVGMRVYSRLVEMCRFVKIEGVDYRQRHIAPEEQCLLR